MYNFNFANILLWITTVGKMVRKVCKSLLLFRLWQILRILKFHMYFEVLSLCLFELDLLDCSMECSILRRELRYRFNDSSFFLSRGAWACLCSCRVIKSKLRGVKHWGIFLGFLHIGFARWLGIRFRYLLWEDRTKSSRVKVEWLRSGSKWLFSRTLGLQTLLFSFLKLLKAKIEFEIGGSDALEEEGELAVIVSRSLGF